MNNAAAINAVNRAFAHYRSRQAHTPTNHSVLWLAVSVLDLDEFGTGRNLPVKMCFDRLR